MKLPALLVVLLLFAGCGARPDPAQVAAEYGPRISFSNRSMSAAENVIGQTVYYLDMKVANQGDRTVKFLEVNAVFPDFEGKIAHQERAMVIGGRRPPLGAGQSRDIQLGFEKLPDTWDRSAPALHVTRIELE